MTLKAHFDGSVFIPDEPVARPAGTSVTIAVFDNGAQARPQFADLLELARDLPDAPSDLAAQHDHYLYGGPKR